MLSPEQEQEKRNRIFGSIEGNVCYYLQNLNHAFQEKGVGALFLNDDEVLDSLRRIYQTIESARNSYISEPEIANLLDPYKNRGLYHLVNSISSLCRDEAFSVQYFDASLQFAIVIEIPQIEIARIWLSSTAFDKREEVLSLLPSNLQLNESDLKVLENEFLTNQKVEGNSKQEVDIESIALNSLKDHLCLFLTTLEKGFENQQELDEQVSLLKETQEEFINLFHIKKNEILTIKKDFHVQALNKVAYWLSESLKENSTDLNKLNFKASIVFSRLIELDKTSLIKTVMSTFPEDSPQKPNFFLSLTQELNLNNEDFAKLAKEFKII